MTGVEILCGLALLLILLYYYLTANYDFWKKHNINGPKPILVFGNFKPPMCAQKSLAQHITALYNEYKQQPMTGIYVRRKPALVINDPDLIKTLLIKDFSKFVDRGFSLNEKADPLSAHLFALEPARWRLLRAKLSPVFTSGKLKEMFSMIADCSDSLVKYMSTLVGEENEIDCREVAARYTTDVIGTCVFGINMNSMSEEESGFRKFGKDIFATPWYQLLRFRLREAVPWLYTLLGYVLPYPMGTDFFMKSVKDMVKLRKENKIVRNDFMNTLIDLQSHPEKLGNLELTDQLLAAQAFVFFAAGFETSSTTISNALYELALHQDIQDKLREEINEHHKMNNGKWNYENVKMMPILDAVFKEVLRMYPAVPVITRKSTEHYTFEGTDITIPPRTFIFISAYGIHRDPDIFPNPEVFDITRFTEEEVAKRHPMNYIPFGDGPRNCIGARFAVFQTKLGLIKILREFKVDVCKKTVIPYTLDPRAFLLTPNHAIDLKITKIKH